MPNLILLGSSKKIHKRLPAFPTESKTLRNPQGRLGANMAAGRKLSPVGRGAQGRTIFFSNSFTPWAWAQELSSTTQLLGQSLVLPWHGTTCLLPNYPNHCPGGSTGQQPFPVSILDVANVIWRTGECNSVDMGQIPSSQPQPTRPGMAELTSIDAAQDSCFIRLSSLHANLSSNRWQITPFSIAEFSAISSGIS